MDAEKKKDLAVDLRKAKTERQMSAFLDKVRNEQVKALFDKWKVKVEDDESYHLSQADNQEKSKLNYFSGKKARGRPKTNASNSKLAKILKSIVKESAPTATLLADLAYAHVEFAIKYMGSAVGNQAFYESGYFVELCLSIWCSIHPPTPPRRPRRRLTLTNP